MMRDNPAINNPAINYAVCKIIDSYNWSQIAYGFDSDWERIKYGNSVLFNSNRELLFYYVRLFLSGATFETIKEHKEFKNQHALTPVVYERMQKVVTDYIDANSRELISLIAKQQILDGKDSSMILAHFLTIPELERFYGKLIVHGFPSVILATSYMISELALVCFDYYTHAYIQRMHLDSHKFAKDVNYHAPY